jgi:sulfur transfer complex TusBCD TusB component (DsrH family)
MQREEEKILTWHPAGRKGVLMAATQYTAICNFILTVLRENDVTTNDLMARAGSELSTLVYKDISWHVLVVKLDLEARGLITSVTRSVPYRVQVLRLNARALKKFKPVFLTAR